MGLFSKLSGERSERLVMPASVDGDHTHLRLQHYGFAHKALPHVVHTNPQAAMTSLLDDAERFLGELWAMAGKRAAEVAGQTMDRTFRPAVALRRLVNQTAWHVIPLPQPRVVNEAFFVAIGLHTSDGGWTARVMTLELALHGCVLGGWTADGTHHNFGAVTLELEPERFLDLCLAQPVRPAVVERTRAWLRHVSGPTEILDHELVASTTIGRHPDADLQILERTIARQHCELRWDAGWKIRDCDSPSGTWVNGSQIRETTLAHGDRIRIGGTELEFLARLEPSRATRWVEAFVPPAGFILVQDRRLERHAPPDDPAFVQLAGDRCGMAEWQLRHGTPFPRVVQFVYRFPSPTQAEGYLEERLAVMAENLPPVEVAPLGEATFAYRGASHDPVELVHTIHVMRIGPFVAKLYTCDVAGSRLGADMLAQHMAQHLRALAAAA